MTSTETIAQIIGVVAMLFNVLSYQGKKQKTVIALQLCGGALFAVNYLLLGAAVGGILNILATIRAVIFLFKEKLKADRLPWLFGFVTLFIAVYILNFTVFGKEVTAANLIIEILPVIGMTSLNIGFRLKDAAAVRRCGLVSSPCWMIYNLAVGSYGAIFCEIFSLSSVIIGMLRHDKKKAEPLSEEEKTSVMQ